MLKVYHNARCSKSRECIAFLNASETEFEIVEYLKNPLKSRELKSLLKKLMLKPIDLVRTHEKEWEPYKNKPLSNDEIVRLLAKHPILMQRPIALNGDKAVIARPLENIRSIL